MSNGMSTNRAAKALRAAQTIVKSEFSSAVNDLSKHPVLAYLVMHPWDNRWSPDIDIAVRLYVCASRGRSIDEKRVRRDLKPRHVTPECITAARVAIGNLTAKMKSSALPSAAIVHVDGDEDVHFFVSGYSHNQALESVAHWLGDEILCY